MYDRNIKYLPAEFLIDYGIGKLAKKIDEISLSQLLELKDSAEALTYLIDSKLMELPEEIREEHGINITEEILTK